MRPVDPRLLRYATAARGYLVLTVGLGLATTALILAQAGLLAHALAAPATGVGVAALGATLGLLLAVLAGRAIAVYGGELAALRAAAAVKSQLRRKLTAHVVRLGPAWLGGQQTGELATLSTKGLDALDPYFARFLPQLVLAFLVPVAVLIRVGLADWISAVVIAVTLPLIPVFAVLIGLQTRAQTERQWRLLARLGGHFLDVVEGLPTLKLFGRAKPQAAVIREVTDAHRHATMRTLRVAFLSALVLELTAAVATALVAVEVGLRLLAGHIPYQTALLVLLLTPEAYLPLRAVGLQFHASMEGVTAAGRACEILDTPLPAASQPAATAGPGRASGPPAQADLRRDVIFLNGASLTYPGRDRAALDRVSLTIRPGERVAIGQELAAGPAAAVRRPDRGAGRGRPAGSAGDRHLRVRPGRLAPPAGLGAPAPLPVRRHRGQQHRPGLPRRVAGRHRARGRPGRRGGVHRVAAP
jgi:ATP-binding cassette, subfamily C, bacterial CydD